MFPVTAAENATIILDDIGKKSIINNIKFSINKI